VNHSIHHEGGSPGIPGSCGNQNQNQESLSLGEMFRKIVSRNLIRVFLPEKELRYFWRNLICISPSELSNSRAGGMDPRPPELCTRCEDIRRTQLPLSPSTRAYFASAMSKWSPRYPGKLRHHPSNATYLDNQNPRISQISIPLVKNITRLNFLPTRDAVIPTRAMHSRELPRFGNKIPR